jgi:hypothetical protein
MKLKRLVSVLLSAVMMIALAIPVSAKTMFEAARAINVNKAYQTVLTSDPLDNTFKFTIGAQSTITVYFESDMGRFDYYLYNSDGEEMSSKNFKESSGMLSSNCFNWNDKTEFAKGSCDFTLLKGTYYFQFLKAYSGGNLLKFKISDPNAESVTALSLSLTLDEGDSIQLGGVVSPSTAKVSWKSSDTAVAKVSSSGKVTAVAPGKATITATAGGKTAKILIVVS